MKTILLVSGLMATPLATAQDFSGSYSGGKDYEEIENFDPSTMQMVLSINSFPSFLVVGKDTHQPPNKKYTPKTVSVSGQLQECKFNISTTKYSISTYKLTKEREFLPLEDSLIPETKIETRARIKAALVSVSTSLKLDIDKKFLAACEKQLKDAGKTYVGDFSIAGSKIYTSLDKQNKRAPIVQAAENTKLYLFWNKTDSKIYLLDDEDFTPMTTSEIYAMNPKEDGLYDIRFQPRAKILAAQPQISNKAEDEEDEIFFAH